MAQPAYYPSGRGDDRDEKSKNMKGASGSLYSFYYVNDRFCGSVCSSEISESGTGGTEDGRPKTNGSLSGQRCSAGQ